MNEYFFYPLVARVRKRIAQVPRVCNTSVGVGLGLFDVCMLDQDGGD